MNRRDFVKSLLAVTATVALPALPGLALEPDDYSFSIVQADFVEMPDFSGVAWRVLAQLDRVKSDNGWPYMYYDVVICDRDTSVEALIKKITPTIHRHFAETYG